MRRTSLDPRAAAVGCLRLIVLAGVFELALGTVETLAGNDPSLPVLLAMMLGFVVMLVGVLTVEALERRGVSVLIGEIWPARR